MRLTLMIVPMITLGACTSPTLQTSAQATPQVAAIFDIPMDPGLIGCDRLSNPAALAAASEWAMGQARARVISGQSSSLPDLTTMSANLSAYCSANSGDTVRAAVGQLGGILN